VRKAVKGTVCNLYRVSAKTGVDLASFSKTSDSKDFTLEPISRSYSKKNWEHVQGPYGTAVTIKKRTTNGTDKYILRIPLVNDGTEGKYMLMTSEHSLKNFAETLSRFLTQATFGPTMSVINGWSHSTNTKGLILWLKDQMDQTKTPATLHRAFYRKRADWGLFDESHTYGNVVPMHPCDQYSRWRDYAITGTEYGKPFTISKLASGKFLMSVDGEPRTVMDEFKNMEDITYYEGVGTYIFCKSVQHIRWRFAQVVTFCTHMYVLTFSSLYRLLDGRRYWGNNYIQNRFESLPKFA